MPTGKDICNWALISVGEEPLEATEADDPDSFTGTDPKTIACKSIYSLKRDALLERFPWRFAARSWHCDYTDQVLDISGATSENPVVITASGHLFRDYKYVYISDVEGMTELNGQTLRIAGVDLDAGTFELEGLDGSVYTAYSSGGTVRLRPPFKYEYEFILPSDFLSDLGLYNIGNLVDFNLLSYAYQNENRYEILDGCLQTNEDEIELHYIAKVTDVTKFSPMFTEALVHFMGVDLSKRVSDSRKWVEANWKQFNDIIYRAGQKNAFLGAPKPARPENDWQTAGRW